ncbi:MAG: DUF4159 domain-containing protein, partial [Candidatus Delongbacteria bacterium]|nr:DUF4159 domain-containing protein [Candidatus Delongbacteria bacterium]
MLRQYTLILLVLVSAFSQAAAQGTAPGVQFTIARVKYHGGGDWYGDPTSLPNLLRFIRENTPLDTAPEEAVVELTAGELFSYPYLYLTGHGRVTFSEEEILRLRDYFSAGGFLHVDDNYGLDKYIRSELRRVFPGQEFQELPFDHPLFNSYYDLPNGCPKVHEHDGKPPQLLGLFHEGRLCVVYTYEADLGDGWEDPDVHND